MRTAAVLFACGLALGTYTLNASSNAGLPDGWSTGGEAPKLYAADVDTSDSPSGQGSLVLRRTETSHPYGSAWLAQDIPVESYAGKRVRISMRVRFQDTEPMGGTVFVGTENGSHTSGVRFRDRWGQYQFTLALAPGLGQLKLGVQLKGPGSAKVDGIALQVLGDAPPEQQGTRIQDVVMRDDGPGKEAP